MSKKDIERLKNMAKERAKEKLTKALRDKKIHEIIYSILFVHCFKGTVIRLKAGESNFLINGSYDKQKK